jgi:hypothetical protein
MTHDRHVGSRVGITSLKHADVLVRGRATAPKKIGRRDKTATTQAAIAVAPYSRPSWTRYPDRTPLRMVRPMTIFCQSLCLDPRNSRGERLSCHGVGEPKPSRIGLRWGSLRPPGPSPTHRLCARIPSLDLAGDRRQSDGTSPRNARGQELGPKVLHRLGVVPTQKAPFPGPFK